MQEKEWKHLNRYEIVPDLTFDFHNPNRTILLYVHRSEVAY